MTRAPVVAKKRAWVVHTHSQFEDRLRRLGSPGLASHALLYRMEPVTMSFSLHWIPAILRETSKGTSY